MSRRADFITHNLRLEPVPSMPSIRLYTAHSGSRLSRLSSSGGIAPYWAYPWAGGLALAHHVAANPAIVRGRRALDLGAGSGIVAIAAAKAGASASAAEIDPYGRAATALNAAANGVEIDLASIDIGGEPPPGYDIILGGDVFYSDGVAQHMLPFLKRCASAGIDVLIGDPGRRDLPLQHLEKIADYAVGDVGDSRARSDRVGAVYRPLA